MSQLDLHQTNTTMVNLMNQIEVVLNGDIKIYSIQSTLKLLIADREWGVIAYLCENNNVFDRVHFLDPANLTVYTLKFDVNDLSRMHWVSTEAEITSELLALVST